ncbi:mitochondrial inner membrane protein OXA1L-like [Planoprotostelium fungivorum]|uniref:Mitochondrial inner membrane protein OXA1L-like n=1 Tax=Planoprotostelium fungivorum TaxID=1890364 RepID=A0A2P6NMW3_9EUKA|nr:mitochondrial inner membrane protein OXA1L-like [Planoprotostelium fungivorum]
MLRLFTQTTRIRPLQIHSSVHTRRFIPLSTPRCFSTTSRLKLSQEEIDRITRNPLDDQQSDLHERFSPPEPIAPKYIEDTIQHEEVLAPTTAIPMALDTLSQYLPVEAIVSGLHTYHDATGLPWWGVMASMGLFMKLLNIPFQRIAIRNQRRLSESKALPVLLKALETTVPKDRPKALAAVKRQMKKEGYRVYKNWAFLSTIPVSLLFAVSLRYLYSTEEGLFWFHTLSEVDGWWRLPTLSSFLTLATWEVGQQYNKMNEMKWYKVVRWGVPWLCVMTIPLVSALPQGLHLYWLSVSLLSFGQALYAMRKRMKSA